MSFEFISPNSVQADVNPIGLGIDILLANTPTTFTSNVYDYIRQVKSNIITLYSTNKGERLYDPNFGTNLRFALFQPNTDNIKIILDDLVREPAATYMTYITLTTIEIITAEDDPNLQYDVQITVKYIINNFGLVDQISLFSANGNLTVTSGE